MARRVRLASIFWLASMAAGAFLAVRAASAAGIVIESWDGALDSWLVPSPFGTNASFATGFSSTAGVTNGADSIAIGSASTGPDYTQLLYGPLSVDLTAILGHAQSLRLDVYTPSDSFRGLLQFDFDISNADTGFASLDGFSYQPTNIGSEFTVTVPVSPALEAAFAASSNPTQIIIQVGGGFTAGNETMYLDNLRADVLPDPAPEPPSLMLLGLGTVVLSAIARARSA